MNSHFFAMLFRMKYINRWGLMRNTRFENLSEHSLEVAVLAHCLAVLRNRRFGGNADPCHAAVLGLFHDTAEIMTGDLPTPVKYFNPEIKSAYQQVEQVAQQKLLTLLPDDLLCDYEPLIAPDENDELYPLVKAADKLSALIKCLEEQRMGNTEFAKAAEATKESLKKMNLPEVEVFLQEFLHSFELTLDELD